MKRIVWLDGLRGLACIQVVLCHYRDAFWQDAPFGFMGNGSAAVCIFFIMSGVVLTKPFKKSLLIRNVFARFIRLVVPGIFVLIIVAVLLKLSGNKQQIGLLESLKTFYNQFNITSIAANGLASLNPPLWTMSVEFFGSILVWLMSIAKSNRKSCVLFIISVLFLLRVDYFSLFIFGSLISDKIKKSNPFLGASCLMIGIILCSENKPWLCLNNIGIGLNTGLGAIMLYFGISHFSLIMKFLETKIMQKFGKISFSIYLLNWPIIVYFQPYIFQYTSSLWPRAAYTLTFVSGMFLLWMTSLVLDRYIDEPIVNFARRLKQARMRVKNKLLFAAGE